MSDLPIASKEELARFFQGANSLSVFMGPPINDTDVVEHFGRFEFVVRCRIGALGLGKLLCRIYVLFLREQALAFCFCGLGIVYCLAHARPVPHPVLLLGASRKVGDDGDRFARATM